MQTAVMFRFDLGPESTHRVIPQYTNVKRSRTRGTCSIPSWRLMVIVRFIWDQGLTLVVSFQFSVILSFRKFVDTDQPGESLGL